MLRRLTLSLACLLIAGTAAAEAMQCTARVALNRIYDVSLDLETGEARVSNDAGTNYTGRATRSVSGSTGDTFYFLATDFGSGIGIDFENGGANRIALCLAANECYLCRP